MLLGARCGTCGKVACLPRQPDRLVEDRVGQLGRDLVCQSAAVQPVRAVAILVDPHRLERALLTQGHQVVRPLGQGDAQRIERTSGVLPVQLALAVGRDAHTEASVVGWLSTVPTDGDAPAVAEPLAVVHAYYLQMTALSPAPLLLFHPLRPVVGRAGRFVRESALVNPLTEQQHGDAEAMSRLADGDRDAVGILYDRYGSVVYGLARRMVRDPELAAEVVQDVFVTVWQKAGQYDPARARVVTWLMTLAHNKAIDRVRREATQRRDVEPTPLDERLQAPESEGTEHVAIGNAVGGRVRLALSQLPLKQREVIERAYFGGWTQSELAESMDLPLGTVKTRMFHGLRRLKELLEAEGFGEST